MFLFVFASACAIIPVVFLTMTMFTDSDFKMGGPPVKVLACGR